MSLLFFTALQELLPATTTLLTGQTALRGLWCCQPLCWCQTPCWVRTGSARSIFHAAAGGATKTCSIHLVVSAKVTHRCRNLSHQHTKLTHPTRGKGTTCNLLMFRSSEECSKMLKLKVGSWKTNNLQRPGMSHYSKPERLPKWKECALKCAQKMTRSPQCHESLLAVPLKLSHTCSAPCSHLQKVAMIDFAAGWQLWWFTGLFWSMTVFESVTDCLAVSDTSCSRSFPRPSLLRKWWFLLPLYSFWANPGCFFLSWIRQ